VTALKKCKELVTFLKNRSLESALAGIRRCDTGRTRDGVRQIRLLLEISGDFPKSVEWAGSHPSYIQAHKCARNCSQRREADAIRPADLPHSPEEFAMRKNDYSDPHLGAWRAYYKALVEAGVYVGANALEVPETGTTVRLREGKRRVQDGPFADTKEQLAGFIILELPSIDAGLEWAARCPGASIGAVEVRPLAPEAMRRGFTG